MGSRWRPYVARIPSHWPLGVFLGASFSFAQKFNCLSNSRCYAGPDFWSTLRKIEAFFTSWGLAGAPVWPESHRTDLLGMVSSASFSFDQKPRVQSNSQCYAGSELWSTLIKIQACFISWGLGGGPVCPESHGTGLLGCF